MPIRHRSPSYRTTREVAFPASRSTVNESLGIATVSINWRAVATLCSSRRSIVGGPSTFDGKKDGGFEPVPGTGIVPERWETGPSAGDDDGWERTTSDEAEVWAGGQDGVDSGDGLGRRGMLTQS